MTPKRREQVRRAVKKHAHWKRKSFSLNVEDLETLEKVLSAACAERSGDKIRWLKSARYASIARLAGRFAQARTFLALKHADHYFAQKAARR